jgi:hypothetical protein
LILQALAPGADTQTTPPSQGASLVVLDFLDAAALLFCD